MRLQKYLARAGIASRRASEELIRSGRVSVNGTCVTEMGTKVIPGSDRIEVDGCEVVLPDDVVVLMLNKPAGFLSAMSDPHGGRCVSELVPTDTYPGLFPVGRLDKDTTGLLLFTNDGELGNALIHPRHHVPKTYYALLEGSVGEREIDLLREGVLLDDGITLPAQASILEQREGETLISITIFEGRNRQIRRMAEAIGHPVRTLTRRALGPLELGDLAAGQWRKLDEKEQRALRESSTLSRDRMEMRTK